MGKRPQDEFDEELRLYLLTAGMLGKKENDICKRFQYHPRTKVIMELEALWATHKVQRFTVGRGHVWRATTLAND